MSEKYDREAFERLPPEEQEAIMAEINSAGPSTPRPPKVEFKQEEKHKLPEGKLEKLRASFKNVLTTEEYEGLRDMFELREGLNQQEHYEMVASFIAQLAVVQRGFDFMSEHSDG